MDVTQGIHLSFYPLVPALMPDLPGCLFASLLHPQDSLSSFFSDFCFAAILLEARLVLPSLPTCMHTRRPRTDQMGQGPTHGRYGPSHACVVLSKAPYWICTRTGAEKTNSAASEGFNTIYIGPLL
jgi:hypothetical protein